MNLQAIQQVADDIHSITIQGATNIAKIALETLMQELKTQKFKTLEELNTFVHAASKLLTDARPTEPMLFNGLKAAAAELKAQSSKQTLSLNSKHLTLNIIKALKTYVLDIQGEEKIRPAIGAKVIKNKMSIVTHCHSGSVVKVLTTARDQGKKIHVYNTETRPLFQGRRTSKDLLAAGVPDTMITDDTAPFFVDNIYDSHVDIDMVIIGSDCIKLNGDVFNKVGSFAIALAAWHSGIPVYIVGSLMKVDGNDTVQIEKRDGKELRPESPQGLDILNFAFDRVPAKFITGIITEYGIIKPSEVKKYVKTYYPWMIG